VLTLMGPLTGVYKLDERLSYEPGYSTYWTEVGLRALWNTTGKNGNYTLRLEKWDKNGNIVAASPNNFATLNLRLLNNAPSCSIHKIQYDDGSTILSSPASECDTVYLIKNDGSTGNDTIQFEITAKQADGFMGRYQLSVFHGHDSPDGDIVNVAYTEQDPPTLVGIDHFVVPTTTSTLLYQSCAYRFCLHVWPRITNGYDPHIYEREDNWYVCIKVVN
ncbi:hypothetical protein KA005_44370, partial [bacterium]|nr:hypothetical protein [bacterium]